MEQKYPECYQCTACGETLTDETAIFDVEGDDAPYCEQFYYEYPYGSFFGEYDKHHDEHKPTEEQQFCLNCQECCKNCWHLESGKGCVIYPHRPQYCTACEWDKLKAKFG